METAFKVLFVASIVAAFLGALYWMLRKPESEKRWHIFYTVYQKDDLSYSPLYRVGCDVGSRSVPLMMIGVDFDWELVSGAGYETRDQAIAAANEIETGHLRDLAALPDQEELKDADSTVFLPRMGN